MIETEKNVEIKKLLKITLRLTDGLGVEFTAC